MADYDFWNIFEDLHNVNYKFCGEALQLQNCCQIDQMFIDQNANLLQLDSVGSEIREDSPVSVAWNPSDYTVTAGPVADSELQVQQNPISVDFQIDIKRGKGTKDAPFMFSSDLNKLFANHETNCPVQLNTTIPAQCKGQFHIRVHMAYSEDDHMWDQVQRCPEHAKGDPQQPVMKCSHPDAKYGKLGIHDTILLPLDFCSKDGLLYTVTNFKFFCLSTCPSIRRRLLKLVFALEFEGCILVEKSIALKISKCPGRDIKSEERKMKIQAVRSSNK
jgi:hypothetical protein